MAVLLLFYFVIHGCVRYW
uniref:Uncharacterized protein n=1 Tax=Anguilla anguilla TaxID=7936 RepID=A0A0E9QYN9_ANGAN